MPTRPSLKSCLKITPPITPDLSAASSPCGSGRTSPSMGSDGGSSTGSGGRKTVSFCSEHELEEVFFVDEWDRTPAAVTPKLSYQDILELKQLRISLPYTPPPPTSRQPFTTSAPSSSGAGPSNKPAFPVSRFATGPSHTPSKWKNRSQPQQAEVDPEILPYLDAVPIRLLPLLPQSPSSEPEPSSAPEPHPQTPTPTASPERRPAPPPPNEPPEIRIEPAAALPVSPPSPPQTRKLNVAFLPLLPVQDPPPVLPPPVSNTDGPSRLKRTFNMTFLPVNAIPESAPLTPAHATSEARTDGMTVGTSASVALPSPSSSVSGCDPRSNDAGQLAPPSPSELSSVPTPTPTVPQACSMSPPPLSLSLPLASREPAGLESDNDTETDTTDTYASDTDAESDAPSTSTLGSSLNSPPLEDQMEVEARLEQIKLGTDDLDAEHPVYVSRVHTQDPGSYFPPVPYTDAVPLPRPIPAHAQAEDVPPVLPSGPGQTPPLSMLYPSPTSQHQPLLPLDAISSTSAGAPIPSAHPRPPTTSSQGTEVDVDVPSIAGRPSLLTGIAPNSSPTTPLSMSQALRKKITLEALPSPALIPPSPFELEPLSVVGASPTPAPLSTRVEQNARITMARTRMELDLASDASAEVMKKLAALSVAEPLAPTAGLADSPDDSPMLTLESMRAAWDASGRVGLGIGVEAKGLGPRSALAPSLSRRRSS
ncbi:hypothetical protein BV20DRAFT_979926 [Pilatotrama ljubarskyi]|nr:hypothetical protein BV20DRAFT_979926 [Pilatotrama ljubarskyi]